MNGLVLMAAIVAVVAGAILGVLIGGFRKLQESPAFAPVVIVSGAVLLVVTVSLGENARSMVAGGLWLNVSAVLGFIFGVAGALALFASPPGSFPSAFGSSRWANEFDLQHRGWTGRYDAGEGLFLGRIGSTDKDIVYSGDMHALTIAPTRAGKGATAIIPNLLSLNSSILVIDPKGENARRTAARRQRMGHDVRIIDPWGISIEADRYGDGASPDMIACYNPLADLDPESPDLATDAMMLADALVIPSGGDNRFWDEEAKGLIFGFILYLVTDRREQTTRTLGRLRDLLTLPMEASEDPDEFSMMELLVRMGMSENNLVRASGNRFAQKEDKERSGVLSSAQANTHFLDSPKLRENLSHSDFSFSDLKTADTPVTVYLVLPLDRLPTFSRWLRLLVISGLKDLMRLPHDPDRAPVRIILDEFAALKRLDMVKEAYGTMAGLGVQLWAITQDLGQLKELYGESWQTFVGNAGVFQYFGSRDHMTAQYASQLTGITTVKKRSNSSSSGSSSSGGSSSESVSYDDVQRPLAYPDELMTIPRNLELLFIENSHPIIARKVEWFEDHEMSALQAGEDYVIEAQPGGPQPGSTTPEEAYDPFKGVVGTAFEKATEWTKKATEDSVGKFQRYNAERNRKPDEKDDD